MVHLLNTLISYVFTYAWSSAAPIQRAYPRVKYGRCHLLTEPRMITRIKIDFVSDGYCLPQRFRTARTSWFMCRADWLRRDSHSEMGCITPGARPGRPHRASGRPEYSMTRFPVGRTWRIGCVPG